MKVLASAALVALALLAARPARAVDRDACAVPYEQAQVLRKQLIFTAAQEQLDACKASCPAVLAADCSLWAAEIKALTPTVVFRVHDAAGRGVDAFRAAVDGTALGVTSADVPAPVNPGEHVFRIEATGFAASEVHAKLSEGEHARVVDVTLTSSVPKAAEPGPASNIAQAPRARSHALAYTLVGIGAAGLAAGGVLSVVGLAERANLRDTCAPGCAPSSVTAIQTMWWVGGVSAAVGAASATVGAVLWLKPARAPDALPTAWFAPFVGLGTVGVHGAF